MITDITPLLGRIHQGDCLAFMKQLPDKCVDLVLCDLPYGTTDCKWDSIIPFDVLWGQYKRIIKDNSPIVLTAREPFTSKLVCSNLAGYKHKWVWNKKQSGSPQNAKFMPLQIEEDIVVFGVGRIKYYPIMRKGKLRKKGGAKKSNAIMGGFKGEEKQTISDMYFPTNIIEMVNPRLNKHHPTEKPVSLFEYLIKTYSLKGDVVLDNCMGSGTTAVACERLGRKWFGCELEPKYVEIANKRIEAERNQLKLF